MYPGGSGGDGWAVGTEDAPTRRTSVIGGGVTPLTPSLRRSSGSSGSGGRNRPAGRLAEHLWKCTLTPPTGKSSGAADAEHDGCLHWNLFLATTVGTFIPFSLHKKKPC